jgi:hypothetical protein
MKYNHKSTTESVNQTHQPVSPVLRPQTSYKPKHQVTNKQTATYKKEPKTTPKWNITTSPQLNLWIKHTNQSIQSLGHKQVTSLNTKSPTNKLQPIKRSQKQSQTGQKPTHNQEPKSLQKNKALEHSTPTANSNSNTQQLKNNNTKHITSRLLKCPLAKTSHFISARIDSFVRGTTFNLLPSRLQW